MIPDIDTRERFWFIIATTEFVPCLEGQSRKNNYDNSAGVELIYNYY